MENSSKTLLIAMVTAFILIKLTWAESRIQFTSLDKEPAYLSVNNK